uniref:Uncharacterized protein n=1 Tax=Cannabis sativa TaxID=3483 RepID=A0A803QDF7_CANSA
MNPKPATISFPHRCRMKLLHKHKDSLSMEDIAHMVGDLEELVVIELQEANRPSLLRGSLLTWKLCRDGKVEEVNQYIDYCHERTIWVRRRK